MAEWELEVQSALSGEHIACLVAEASWNVLALKEALTDVLAPGTCVQALVGDACVLLQDRQALADVGLRNRSVVRAIVGRNAIGRYFGGDAEHTEEAMLTLLAAGHSEFHACCHGKTSTSSQRFTLFGTWCYTAHGHVEVNTTEREFKSDLVKPLLNEFGCRDTLAVGSGNWGTSRSQYKKTLIFECYVASSCRG
mmetsp:Transcript_32797/g.90583  ORF Transcript_32797/g.90583 Transcript_32797/m.90583 type:complete len:195 (-) Transcript_32797:188-772(-)